MSKSKSAVGRRDVKAWKDPETLRYYYHKKGMSLSEVGSQLGCSGESVRVSMKQLDVNVRDWMDTITTHHATFHTEKSGYEVWISSTTDYTEKLYVHQLIAIANGESPHDVFSSGENNIHHKNEIKWDNRPSNITLLRNDKHTSIHMSGENNPISKLTEGDVIQIRSKLNRGMSQYDIADEYKLSQGTVGAIYRNEIWKDV